MTTASDDSAGGRTFGGNIIGTGADSHRLAATRARAEQAAAAAG